MAFTLIELLIAVAIIGILAAIAVPNFLEAQTRAKVSRAMADMRAIVTALEAYRVDTNHYPEDYAAAIPQDYGLGRLTSPVAYITNVPLDPFGGYVTDPGGDHVTSFTLGTAPDDQPIRFALTSVGPDREDSSVPLFDYPGYSDEIWENPTSGFDYVRYDPTNGTVSRGDIYRLSDHNME